MLVQTAGSQIFLLYLHWDRCPDLSKYPSYELYIDQYFRLLEDHCLEQTFPLLLSYFGLRKENPDFGKTFL